MRCKNCKEKFEAKYFNQKFCMEKDECIKAFSNQVQEDKEKAKQKKWNKEKTEKLPDLYPKKYKNFLQVEINKLSKMIDKKFGFVTCIDCGKDFGKQTDAGHFNSCGSNPTIRYNLHNVHSQNSKCNQFDGGRRLEYYRGLVTRYGQKYADYVDTGLQKEFTYIGLSNQEVAEKLKVVRKIVRDFDTFKFTSSLNARIQLNNLIGIYPVTKGEIDFIENRDDHALNEVF